MTSSINYSGVDETFPIAGVDNETQGFRENFAVIKNSLAAAKGEIEDLQAKALLKAALSDSVLSNDMQAETIVNLNLASSTMEVFRHPGVVVAGADQPPISFESGHYQVFSLGDNITFSITDWPTNGTYGCVRVELYGDGTSRTVGFQVTGNKVILKDNSFPGTLTVQSETTPKIIEIWSSNGTTFFLKYLGAFA